MIKKLMHTLGYTKNSDVIKDNECQFIRGKNAGIKQADNYLPGFETLCFARTCRKAGLRVVAIEGTNLENQIDSIISVLNNEIGVPFETDKDKENIHKMTLQILSYSKPIKITKEELLK